MSRFLAKMKTVNECGIFFSVLLFLYFLFFLFRFLLLFFCISISLHIFLFRFVTPLVVAKKKEGILPQKLAFDYCVICVCVCVRNRQTDFDSKMKSRRDKFVSRPLGATHSFDSPKFFFFCVFRSIMNCI